MNKLTQTLREEWVKALESGEYKQCKGALEREGTYCCLGVACVIAEKHGIEVIRDDQRNIVGGDFDHQPAVDLALLLCEHAQSKLVELNDAEERNFAEIAKFIRNHWNFIFA